jgi:two-component system, chemotaxis family, protein-glutamate methylesterase/glutaminase
VIRVLIVDDSAFVRQALVRMLSSAPDIEVVGIAVDGKDGLEKAVALRPDVVTLDIKMPRMGGLEALRRIMTECPVPVLLLSSLTSEGGEITLRGLELGALDFVDKSSVKGHMNLLELADELKAKVRALARVPRDRVHAQEGSQAEPRAPLPAPHLRGAEVVVIGTSTGGPPALQAIIPKLPSGLASSILVVQHMPVGFTRSLADRLASRSALPVREAEDGDSVAPGVVLIAPAGRHMKVQRRGAGARVWLDDEPRSSLHRPSVDVLMASVAKAYGPRSLGVVLTGMGSDGVEGLRAIRQTGGRTFAESEESCVIYGMPKAAVEAGVVDRSVPLARMADEILAAV